MNGAKKVALGELARSLGVHVKQGIATPKIGLHKLQRPKHSGLGSVRLIRVWCGARSAWCVHAGSKEEG